MTSTWWLLLLWFAIRGALFFAAAMTTAVAASPGRYERETTWHLKLMAATALWLAWWVWAGLVPESPTQQRKHREPAVIVVV